MQNKFEERFSITFENQSQKLFGIIHRPLETVKCPAVIFCYGFEGNKCGKNRLYVTLAQELTKLGFVVLRFDYRGSGDSEGEFQEITLENEVSDTLKAIELLSADSQVDKDRICLLHVLGGIVATLTAERHNSIKSMVLWAPVFSSRPWKDLWMASKKDTMVDSQLPEFGRLKNQIPNQTFLLEFFNLNLIESLHHLNRMPLLLIHGEIDSTVKIEQSESYKKARESSSAITSFLRLPNTAHDFSDPVEQKIAIKKTCEWFHQTT